MSQFRHFANSLMEGFFIAVNALMANKTRSILTTLGIVIGVLTVTLMMMIIQGLNKSFAEQISFLGSNTVYVEKWPWVQDDWWNYINRPKIKYENFEYLRDRMTKADAVSVIMDVRRSVSFRDRHAENVSITGTTPEGGDALSLVPAVGRFVSESDIRAGRRVCMIGADVQDAIFGAINPIEREIRVGSYKYRIVGVLERKGSTFGMSLDNQIIIPASTFLNTYGRNRYMSIVVRGRDEVSQDDLVDEIRRYMRQSRGLRPLEKDDFSINKQEALTNLYKTITAGVYAAGLVIGGIALLVGGIGIMNIMLVSVAERTWEVGLRKAIGARTAHILWQFLLEAVLICTIGGAMGIGLAAIGGSIIKQFFFVHMPVWLIVSSVGFSAVVGVLFGIFPAMKAARLDPIVALRQE